MDDIHILRSALEQLRHQRRSSIWVFEIAAGPCILLFGGYAFHRMWMLPVVTAGQLSVCFLIMAVGGYLFRDACERRRAQIQLKEQVAKVSECAQELIEGVRRVRKEGGNAYEYLASQGITVSDIRKYLIDRAKQES